MPYLIQTFDKPGHGHVRDELRAAHLAFLDANVGKLLVGGASVEEGAGRVYGGTILLDVDSRAEAEAFLAQDPFTKGELFERVEYIYVKAAFFDRRRITPPVAPASPKG